MQIREDGADVYAVKREQPTMYTNSRGMRYTRVPQTNALVAIPSAPVPAVGAGAADQTKSVTFAHGDLLRLQTYRRFKDNTETIMSMIHAAWWPTDAWHYFPLKIYFQEHWSDWTLQCSCNTPYKFLFVRFLVAFAMSVLWIPTAIVFYLVSTVSFAMRGYIFTDELLFGSNLIAMSGHLTLLILTLTSKGEAKDDIFFNRPDLRFDCTVDREDVRWGNGVGLGMSYEVVTDALDAKIVTSLFFALSFAFHLLYLIWIGVSWTSEEKHHGDCFYTQMLVACNQPLRFLEYSFSSAIMIFMTIFIAGSPDFRICFAGATLLFVTNTYGWLCECLSPPANDGREWKHKSLLRRWFVNLVGYVPFLVAYYLVLSPFLFVVTTCEERDEVCPAEWVTTLVYVQFAIFASFGIVSLYVQSVETNVAKVFVTGELTYTCMSLFAKALLGVTLYINVLQLSGSIGANVLLQNSTRSSELTALYNSSCPATA